MFPATNLDCWYLATKAFGTSGHPGFASPTETSPGSVSEADKYMDIETFLTHLHVFAYRWSHSPSLEWRSGIDARGQSIDAQWLINAVGALNLTPLIFCETSAQLLVGKYRACSVLT
jgi:hypothetical protein